MPTIKSDELVVFNRGQILHGGNKVGYIASVKNTPEGRAWIKQLERKNPQYEVVYYATGTNRRERFKLSGKEMPTWEGKDAGNRVPASVVERFRVYLYNRDIIHRYGQSETDLNKIVL